MTDTNLSRCPIGVFDSGLGGLTAFRELRRLLPNEDIVYFGDTGRVPYGTKSRDTILSYARQDVDFLLSQNVKMVIAACGTVSANVPDDFADSLPVPFTGVVQHTCAAAINATRTGHIGIIATPATIRSKAYETYIHKLSPEMRVTANHCSLFVPLVENGFVERDNLVTRLVAEQYLSPLFETDVDTLILGCTHYPLLADIIGDILGPSIRLIDSGKATAAFAGEYLRQNHLLSDSETPGTNRFFVSDSIDGFVDVANIFLGGDLGGEVSRIHIG